MIQHTLNKIDVNILVLSVQLINKKGPGDKRAAIEFINAFHMPPTSFVI